MKARYPLTRQYGKRASLPEIHWCEQDERGVYVLDGKIQTPASCVDSIRAYPARAIVFFPDLRRMVGGLIPHLLENGKLIGAGDVVRNLHYKEETKTVYLADASLYFTNPKFEQMQTLNQVLFDCWRVKLAPTPGNTAMRVLRRFVNIDALFQPADNVRRIAQAAMTGGALHWQVGTYPRAYKYDVKSAYAWVMKNIKVPLRPRLHGGVPNVSSEGMIFIATVDFDTKRVFSPMVLYGGDDEAYHPTKAEGVVLAINHIDMQTLMGAGNFQIREIHNTITWSAGPRILAESMERLDDLGCRIIEIKPAIKIIRNSTFGKTAERDEMSTLSLCLFGDHDPKHEIVDLIESEDTLYVLSKEKKYNPAPQHNPILAGLITAAMRKRIYETIDHETVYVDTDGFISTGLRTDLSTGSEQGDWYLDETGSAIVLGPRIYGLAGKTKIAGQHEYVSMKKLRGALEREIEVYESTVSNPLSMDGEHEGVRTLKSIKYPHVEAIGDTLYVTRSPTVKIKSRLPDWI